MDKWENQEHRIEVWVEKDALLGILGSVCHDLDVDYFSCRGYNFQSEMWGAAMRLRQYLDDGQTPVVIHLGDHDPSGVDMTRDIEDRLRLFTGGGVELRRIALTMEQVHQYDPPPNPAKITDSRAEGYIKEYGNDSWELDALDPGMLADLIRDTIIPYRDRDALAEQIRRERRERRAIHHLSEIGKVIRAERGE